MTEDGTQGSPLTVHQAAADLLNFATAQESDTDESSEPQEDENDAKEASEESEQAEPAQEADDAESDESDEAEDDPKSEPRKIKVQLEDGEVELPEDELKKGYMRTADYTRKTQHAAEVRKQAEAELAQAQAVRSNVTARLDALDKALDSIIGKEPDWETLKQGDPATFAAKWAEWDQGQKAKAQVAAEKAAIEAESARERARVESERLKQEGELLLAAIPEWKDAAVAKTEKTAIAEYGIKLGFTPEELQIKDHRLMKLLRDGWRGQQKAAAKPAVKAKIDAVKIASPGTPTGRVASKDAKVKEAAKRVAKTGSLKDGVDWLVKATS